MASRSFIQPLGSLIKRRVDLFAAVSVGGGGAVTLQMWNYPVFGTGPNARTYTAAPTGSIPSNAGNYPGQYTVGSEGILSVVRTGAGLWTVRLQDNYQRLVGLSAYASLAGGLSAIVGVAENTTISNMAAAGGSLVGVALLSATATALDPASGEVVKLHFTLADATEP